jgi:hypothetical protein
MDVRFEVFMAVTPAQAGSSLVDFSTLKMEAIRSSETSAHIRSTRRHIPEDGILLSILKWNFEISGVKAWTGSV